MRSRRGAYRIYGLTLESSLALPCLPSGPRRSAKVRLEAAPVRRFARARAEAHDGGGRPTWFRCSRLDDGSTYLRWRELFEFLISPDGRRIGYRRLQHGTRESFSVYLLAQVVSFSLLAFGVEPLHGTVIDVDGEAVAFLGDCGYGKSTLGAALLARGYPILTDDLVVVEARNADWMVHPGIPRLKLFPAVARRLLGSGAGVPMNQKTSKLVLSLTRQQSARRVLPLKAIYVLSDPARRAPRSAASFGIDPLSGADAFLEVIRGTFNPVVQESSRLARQFDFARRLVSAVPIRRLTYRRTLSMLPAVCDAVLTDLARQNLRTTAVRQKGPA